MKIPKGWRQVKRGGINHGDKILIQPPTGGPKWEWCDPLSIASDVYGDEFIIRRIRRKPTPAMTRKPRIPKGWRRVKRGRTRTLEGDKYDYFDVWLENGHFTGFMVENVPFGKIVIRKIKRKP